MNTIVTNCPDKIFPNIAIRKEWYFPIGNIKTRPDGTQYVDISLDMIKDAQEMWGVDMTSKEFTDRVINSPIVNGKHVVQTMVNWQTHKLTFI